LSAPRRRARWAGANGREPGATAPAGPRPASSASAGPGLAGSAPAEAAWDVVDESDVVIVGAGTAGLTAALGLAPLRVTVLSKTVLGAGGASVLAQGGIAAAVGRGDSPAAHAADTLAAGAGLSDAGAVDALAMGGPAAIRALVRRGARFDRDAAGRLALGREAAHGRSRIVHARDATGAEIVQALVASVRAAPHVRLHDRAFAVDLVRAGGRVVGVVARHADGRSVLHRGAAVVLATGGIGRIYRYTTNPPEATGDGLAMAARAGADLVDLEFVQFHPTALVAGADPLPLLTEALRGEGALLVDDTGCRFMLAAHPLAELAPRDVVARAIWRRLAAGHAVLLDARGVGARFPERFPTVFAACQGQGLDPRIDLLPVSPAAHYHMGGIAVDARGRTSLPGLWACGEVASTGVHGANRLASNSLLEALVFGARAAADVRRAVRTSGERAPSGERPVTAAAPSDPTRAPAASPGPTADRSPAEVEAEMRAVMWDRAGLVRDRAGLARALGQLEAVGPALPDGPTWAEARNMALVARLVAAAALARRESRGAHYRSDHPAADPAWQRRLHVRLGHGAWGPLDVRTAAVSRREATEVLPSSVEVAA
jgi:L-aspartate oxidase